MQCEKKVNCHKPSRDGIFAKCYHPAGPANRPAKFVQKIILPF